MAKKNREMRCSFCSAPEQELHGLISSPDGKSHICHSCIEICSSMIEPLSGSDVSINTDFMKGLTIPNPHDMKLILDQYVIGQEEVKKRLVVSVYNHYKRVIHRFDDSVDKDVEIEKSNMLLLGPTGTGKTLLAKSLATLLDVPFAVCDATTLTEAGYVGEDVENILLRLIQAADYDISKAEVGIIYVDEIDKISRRTQNVSVTRDVSGEGVQQALLKIIEGTVANVPPKGGRKHPDQECLKINTGNILFICGGAFVGLPKVVKERIAKQSSVGFAVKGDKDRLIAQKEHNDCELLKMSTPEDLVKFGLIPEFIGRIPVVSTMHKLSEADLLHILTEPKNALVKQYKKLFEMEKVDLKFTKAALLEVAKHALKNDTGARGLRSIMENAMSDLMYDLHSLENLKSCTITPAAIRGDSSAVKLTFSK